MPSPWTWFKTRVACGLSAATLFQIAASYLFIYLFLIFTSLSRAVIRSIGCNALEAMCDIALCKLTLTMTMRIKKNEKTRRSNMGAWVQEKLRIRGTEIPQGSALKFCLPGAVHDVIKHANFDEDRPRGFGAARGRILAFSVDLPRCPSNTRARAQLCDLPGRVAGDL